MLVWTVNPGRQSTNVHSVAKMRLTFTGLCWVDGQALVCRQQPVRVVLRFSVWAKIMVKPTSPRIDRNTAECECLSQQIWWCSLHIRAGLFGGHIWESAITRNNIVGLACWIKMDTATRLGLRLACANKKKAKTTISRLVRTTAAA